MSTQNESGIEFGIVAEESRRHFRLLELPPDLLAVITSDTPPTLHLKSQEGPPGHALEANAVLCTPDKTYTLRQVSTSNEVYLAQTSSNSDEVSSQPKLEAVAKCDSTLELQAAKKISAVPYIKAALPVYATTGHIESKEPISKTQLFANIPLSDAECAQAWQDLACFEVDEAPAIRALIPSNGTKLKVWQAILTSATAGGIDLTTPLDFSDVGAISSEHEDWPQELVPAVIASMASQTAEYRSVDLQIDGIKYARAVGEMLLRERTENGRLSVPLKAFTDAWADLLPERWRSRADMNLLEGSYKLENDEQDITFVEGSGDNGSSTTAAAPAEAKSTLGAKRKWHEKFRAAKKTA